jgi:CelD/BcsL family acetyltransferase involved in cellulose biosynthesis
MIALVPDWHDAVQWDEFVERQSEARFSHLWHYGAVTECYGYQRHNFCFLRDGKIVAVLPTVEAKSMLFGRRLISQPFSEYGGFLISPDLDADEVSEVFSLMGGYLKQNATCDVAELHGNHGVPMALRDRAPFMGTNPHHVAYLDVRHPQEHLWRNVINHSARKSVSKARKSGVVISEECTDDLIRDAFFPLYLKSMKRLGSPPHTVGYYLACFRLFGSKMRILWAHSGEKRIAALLGFSCGKRINIINTVSDPEYWHLSPNDLLHWEFICTTAREGFDYFDFGSVRYQGQDTFKKKWGCEMEEHRQYFLTREAKPTMARTFDSSGGMMTRASRLWSRYMPAPISTRLGPTIRQHLMR